MKDVISRATNFMSKATSGFNYSLMALFAFVVSFFVSPAYAIDTSEVTKKIGEASTAVDAIGLAIIGVVVGMVVIGLIVGMLMRKGR